jgi:MATE family, multidrug efflux pump
MGDEGAVRANTLVYLRISLVGVPALLLVLAGAGYLRGLQDTRTPLAVATGTAAGNLVLEVVLIYGLDECRAASVGERDGVWAGEVRVRSQRRRSVRLAG